MQSMSGAFGFVLYAVLQTRCMCTNRNEKIQFKEKRSLRYEWRIKKYCLCHVRNQLTSLNHSNLTAKSLLFVTRVFLTSTFSFFCLALDAAGFAVFLPF